MILLGWMLFYQLSVILYRSRNRRVTTVLCPNGQYRYPVDYYDATPGVVKVSESERQRMAVPGYKQLI